MSDTPTDRPKPKFFSTKDVSFWEKIYIESVKSGEQGGVACNRADIALERRQARLSDDVRQYEINKSVEF